MISMQDRHLLRSVCTLLVALMSCGAVARDAASDWPELGNDGGRSKYSELSQINRSNVTRLEQAWIYHTGDFPPAFSAVESNPLIIDGVLYTTTAKLKVIALSAGTGKLLWSFDPYAGQAAGQTLNRGVSYWRGQDGSRILFTAGSFLYAINAKSGELIQSFGKDGRADLREGLGRNPEQVYVDATSPGAVFEDLIVIGTRVGEGIVSAPGHIRAYDVRTGAIRWTFHTIPKPGEYGYESWPADAWKWAGGANAWGGISVDARRGLVFAGTGSATYDYWGGNRHGDNLFANSTLALDARTGKRVWHYQTIRHDVWDRDLPTPPMLVTVNRKGRKVDAAVQLTKQGVVYVFNRETGESLFPIEEVSVPPSDIPGEKLAATQPIPVLPPPVSRQEFTLRDVNDLTPEPRGANLAAVQSLRLKPRFEPPSLEGTVVHPGLAGAQTWGGGAFDPRTARLFVNSSEVPVILKLLHIQEGIVGRGKSAYLQNCAACHGVDMKGTSEFPSLLGVGARYSRRELVDVLRNGRGRMPGFAHLSFEQLTNLMDYIYGGQDVAGPGEKDVPVVPYVLDAMRDLLGPDGYPAIKPPWGTLSAVNLNSGAIEWQVILGEYKELSAKGIPPTGTKNFGGPIVTAGGLVFIGATMDEKFRAFDAGTGKVLWEADLPGSAFTIPSTYMVDGRQFVVVAAGGGQGRKPSDAYIAYALPCAKGSKATGCTAEKRASPAN